MKDRNNARRQTVIYICGGCWVWGPDSTARGIYQWDNQTYISGTQIWILIGRISNLEIKIYKSLHAITQHVKTWEVMRTLTQNNSEDWRITKDIIWEKKRLRLELPKHGIRNIVLYSTAVQFKTGLPHYFISWLWSLPSLPTHACTHTRSLMFLFTEEHTQTQGFPGGSDGKAPACHVGDLGLIPGLGRSPGEGNGNPLQYSCLENSMDRGAW